LDVILDQAAHRQDLGTNVFQFLVELVRDVMSQAGRCHCVLPLNTHPVQSGAVLELVTVRCINRSVP
jgi:hypothetical protein